MYTQNQIRVHFLNCKNVMYICVCVNTFSTVQYLLSMSGMSKYVSDGVSVSVAAAPPSSLTKPRPRQARPQPLRRPSSGRGWPERP